MIQAAKKEEYVSLDGRDTGPETSRETTTQAASPAKYNTENDENGAWFDWICFVLYMAFCVLVLCLYLSRSGADGIAKDLSWS